MMILNNFEMTTAHTNDTWLNKKLPVRLNYWMYCFSPTWHQGNSKTLITSCINREKEGSFNTEGWNSWDEVEETYTRHQKNRTEVAVPDLCKVVICLPIGKCKIWTAMMFPFVLFRKLVNLSAFHLSGRSSSSVLICFWFI